MALKTDHFSSSFHGALRQVLCRYWRCKSLIVVHRTEQESDRETSGETYRQAGEPSSDRPTAFVDIWIRGRCILSCRRAFNTLGRLCCHQWRPASEHQCCGRCEWISTIRWRARSRERVYGSAAPTSQSGKCFTCAVQGRGTERANTISSVHITMSRQTRSSATRRLDRW